MKAINKQEEQLKKIKDKKKQKICWLKKLKRKKSREAVLLKDNLNHILMTFDVNFSNKGEDIFKNVVSDERMINYRDLFFCFLKQNILSFIIKRFGTLYNLFIDLLNEKISIFKAQKEQKEMEKR